MCGIFAYIGFDAVAHSLTGLKKLEYRGYDSAGIAYLADQLHIEKAVGKIQVLEDQFSTIPMSKCAIAHTRWATHGKVTKENAHPHLDTNQTLALVHNGIIENHHEIKQDLTQIFQSQTDTECVVHLIDTLNEEDLLEAICEAIKQLKGAFAIVLISKDHPETLFAFCHETTLAVGLGKNRVCIASDPHAFDTSIEKVTFLDDGQIAKLSVKELYFYDQNLKEVQKVFKPFDLPTIELSKEGFEHFMLKEIFEQPQSLKYTFSERIDFKNKRVLPFLEHIDLASFDKFLFLGCGSSFFASLVGKYLFQTTGKEVEVELASEFRYQNRELGEKTLTIAISQSGETADLLAACELVKKQQGKILAICNVQGSQLTRKADEVLLLRCGPEIGVASTKAFLSMLGAILLLSLQLKPDSKLIEELQHLPLLLESILDRQDEIAQIAKQFVQYDRFFYLGRHLTYPMALEGALKLKEIAYVFTEALAAGEMKHGPIALIDDRIPTIAYLCNQHTFLKMRSNLMEIKARGGKILAITEKNIGDLDECIDAIFTLPKCDDRIAIFLATLFSQLFAYSFAKEKHCEIDKPRNLAKSVTVE